MLTAAYIGFGNSVCRYHLPYVENREDIQVKYIYRRPEDRIGDEERESWYPDIIFTSSLEEVLSDPEVNLVVVNTPDRFHASYTMQALEAGKNVLCEKPFAMTSQEAADIFQYAKDHDLVVMSNQNRRFDGDCATVKKVIDSGVLGELVELESHYDYFRPSIKDSKGMGWLYGLTIHPIDQILYLLGMPRRMSYDVRSVDNPGICDDYNDIDFYYEGPLKAIVKTSNYVKIDYPRFIVHGKKGSFIIPPAPHNSASKAEPGAIHIQLETPDESLWGTLSYVDDDGIEHNEKVVREVTDYGKIYDSLNEAITGKGEKVVRDEEVIRGLQIVEEATQIAKEAN